MCLINIAWQTHDIYPLVVLANRDEFYARPTQPLHKWNSGILAGKDLQDGGTWMGVAPDGRFAALTNYRDPAMMRTDRPSRGQIVRQFLEEMSVSELHLWLEKYGADYNGFNLLYGDLDTLYYYSSVRNERSNLSSGIYGLSNASLDSPWPKVKKTTLAFHTMLQGPPDTDLMFNLFSDTTLAEEDALPDTGIDHELEHQLSAVCIRLPHYGTRSTAILLAGNKTGNRYLERSMIPEQHTDLTFHLS